MSLRPLHIRYSGNERRSYYPRNGQAGFSYVTVERSTDGENQQIPWVWRKVFKFDAPGEYTLVADPPSLMLYEPIVLLDVGSHLKDRREEVTFPEEDEHSPGAPVLTKTLALKAEDEGEGTLGFKSVEVAITYNSDDFPVNWMQRAAIRENRWVVSDNTINYSKEWHTITATGIQREYFCGVDLEMTFMLQVLRINKLPLSQFHWSVTGLEEVRPGEMGIWIHRQLDDVGSFQYVIEGHYRASTETLGRPVAHPLSWIHRTLIAWSSGVHIKVGMLGEKDLVETTGSLEDKDQDLILVLDGDKFSMDLRWEPDPEPGE